MHLTYGIKEGRQRITNLEVTKSLISVENNELLFDILSQYSNKLGSIIREITSNMRDSHKEAEIIPSLSDEELLNLGYEDLELTKEYFKNWKNVNLEIEIKEDFYTNTFFLIFRDFGVGLSPKRMSIFKDFLSSTKRTSDKFHGAYGLGAKSPFSYTDFFYVKTCYFKERFHYKLLKNNSLPSIMLDYKEETTDKNSTEIIIPIKQEDIHTIRKEISKQLIFFNNITYINVFDDDIEEKEVIYFDQYVYTKELTNLCICIEEVYYPIDINILKNYDNWKDVLVPDAIIYNFNIGLVFNIGELDIMPHRESLKYTKNTIDKIVKRIIELEKFCIENINKQLELSYEKYIKIDSFYLRNLNIKIENYNLNIIKSTTLYKEFIKYTISTNDNIFTLYDILPAIGFFISLENVYTYSNYEIKLLKKENYAFNDIQRDCLNTKEDRLAKERSKIILIDLENLDTTYKKRKISHYIAETKNLKNILFVKELLTLDELKNFGSILIDPPINQNSRNMIDNIKKILFNSKAIIPLPENINLLNKFINEIIIPYIYDSIEDISHLYKEIPKKWIPKKLSDLQVLITGKQYSIRFEENELQIFRSKRKFTQDVEDDYTYIYFTKHNIQIIETLLFFIQSKYKYIKLNTYFTLKLQKIRFILVTSKEYNDLRNIRLNNLFSIERLKRFFLSKSKKKMPNEIKILYKVLIDKYTIYKLNSFGFNITTVGLIDNSKCLFNEYDPKLVTYSKLLIDYYNARKHLIYNSNSDTEELLSFFDFIKPKINIYDDRYIIMWRYIKSFMDKYPLLLFMNNNPEITDEMITSYIKSNPTHHLLYGKEIKRRLIAERLKGIEIGSRKKTKQKNAIGK